MGECRTVVFAPHDDGSGAVGVLCRLARALVRVADRCGFELELYFLNSSGALDGQARLNKLVVGTTHRHRAVLVPTDNLIWLPKDDKLGAVDGAQLPDILRKWVRPLWHCWPCQPNWIRPNLPITDREEWSRPDFSKRAKPREGTWKQKDIADCGNVRDLTPEFWQRVALGISMGVPQLHRVARREGLPSVEVGDWFFSVGLRGCMQESFVPSDIIAATERDLRMIEKDEFMATEVWLTLHQAPHRAYKAHVANSPVRFREMAGLLWTGDDPPNPITSWPIANDLALRIKNDIRGIRGSSDDVRVAYMVTGRTPVWRGVVRKLADRPVQTGKTAAIVELDRAIPEIKLLEGGGVPLDTASSLLHSVPEEEMHLATCRATDLGIARSAGGVLGCAETLRPSVFVDEPGHWLGRIQREQCHEAGLCVVVAVREFLDDPAGAVQVQADKLGTNSDLDRTVAAAECLQVGAERDLAQYLFETYVA